MPKVFYKIDSWFNRSSERLNLHDCFSRQGKFTHFFKSFIISQHRKIMVTLMHWFILHKTRVNLRQKSFMTLTLGLIDCLRGLTCTIIFHVNVNLRTFLNLYLFSSQKKLVI